MTLHLMRPVWAALLGAVLAGCGGADPTPGPEARATASVNASAEPALSAGQVAPLTSTKVSFYAASRFAEQASFGPTPALVAEIQAKGFERWIDEQFALPFSPIDIKPAEAIYAFPLNVDLPNEVWQYLERQVAHRAVGAPDQLRLRVMWSLSQFIVAATTEGEPPGWVTWINVLYRHAFGRYADLLRDTSIDSHMGTYLDNDQNRPKSAECPHCAPNENYARELMQLFSLGVLKLNPDGTPRRDARGRFIETYTQQDVENLARVLTGWTRDQNPPNRPRRNWGNWGKPMIPSTWPPERDSGGKVVMGTVFPAGQGAEKDLDDAVAMLMAHPNIAPFVSLRLIQHLVKSDPSPAYVGRVAAVFRNNGAGQAGDMKAVLKAVLLDTEARRGDTPGGGASTDGKFREPFLHATAMWRGLGCSRMPMNNADRPEWVALALSRIQHPFAQQSVFSYYAPTDRAPGSNLLAPEQRLLTPEEIRYRLYASEVPTRWDPATSRRSYPNLPAAGCRFDELRDAFQQSPRAFNDLLSARYLRGAMPPTLRITVEQMMSEQWPVWNRNDPAEGALRMLNLALATPYFGVMK